MSVISVASKEEVKLNFDRYVHMQVESVVAYLVAGVPLRDAVAYAVRSSLNDQAQVCDAAGRFMAKGAGEALENWYAGNASEVVVNVRPGIGVADERPVVWPVDFFVNRGGRTPDEISSFGR